jgi:hypothetical protein
VTAAFPPPTEDSEELITRNMGLARDQANKFHRRTGYPYDELEAVAFVGLIHGCRRYDPERINPKTGRSYALSSIVVPWIAGEILHFFRDRNHAIKFPNKWREKWGKVQRLMNDQWLTAQDVAEQSGMSEAEISEMLAAMTSTSNLDDIHGADAYLPPPPEVDIAAPLLAMVNDAWRAMHPGDRGQLLRWWDHPRRMAHPRGPLQQFHQHLKSLLRGRRLSETLQLTLTIAAPNTIAAPKAMPKQKRRSKKQLELAAQQLGLL